MTARTRRAVGIIAALALTGAGAAYADTSALTPPTDWTTVTAWHLPDAPGADFIIKRQLGTGYGDTADDTIPVTLTDSAGDTILTHSSAWTPIDVAQFGVPANATAVKLQFKAVITGIAGTETSVYAFVRRHGSPLCPGPTGFTNYPVDFTWPSEPQGGGEKCWAVHAGIDGQNGVREFDTVDVPLTDGRFDFAWGYRKPGGQWPTGSALAIGVWLDGWAS